MGMEAWPSGKAILIGNVAIELEIPPGVFMPTSTTVVLGESLTGLGGAEVADLGCGCGVLGIYAALAGARRVATVDISAAACAATRKNSIRNSVADRLEIYCGDLFSPLGSMTFDAIICDVSGVADEIARVSPWFPDEIQTGGKDGTQHINRVLADARKYLNRGGTLYFPVLSLSRVASIMQAAHAAFPERLEHVTAREYSFPAGAKHAALFDRLESNGTIEVERKRSRFIWRLDIWKGVA